MYALGKWEPSLREGGKGGGAEGGREGEGGRGRKAFLKVWEEERAWEWLRGLAVSQLVVTAWSLKALGYWCASPTVARAFKEAVEGGREGGRERREEGGADLTDTEAASLLHSLRCIGVDVSEYPPLVLLKGERGGLSSLPSSPISSSSSSSSSLKEGLGGGERPSSPVMLLTRERARQQVRVKIPIFPSGEDVAGAEDEGRKRAEKEEGEEKEEQE